MSTNVSRPTPQIIAWRRWYIISTLIYAKIIHRKTAEPRRLTQQQSIDELLSMKYYGGLENS